jgi:oxygen-independent coproporphyrinogen III oxidase
VEHAPRHVYVHVPFCTRRCSYCDFAIAVRRETPVAEYLAALRAELDLRSHEWSEVTSVDTIYLGGGTPSKLEPGALRDVLDLLRRHFPPGDRAEITLEANPEDVSAATVAAWRDAEITRISLGVQSFEPAVLTWMHRVHDADAARRAARLLSSGGFDSWSLDLIFGLPEDLQRDWDADLREALAFDPPHLSVYGLAVEPHTPLARWVQRGSVADPNDERYEREFLRTHELLERAGYEHYEVSNYARTEHRSRHNTSYWRGVAYVGLGPSAHSFDGRERRWNTREYRAWLDEIARGSDPVGGREVLNEDQRAIERLYLGLRTSAGLPADSIEPRIVERWRREGWAVLDSQSLLLTPTGWLRLDALVAALTVPSTPC